ncbi:MAG: FHA domain-containing protein [Chroococcus sp. CMT-3BRIN-NPC107]|jgi:predicted component of type VI protein secretion system|nr:FHA domain-containing protein [Chroococcus sp. CMT-3BRIN-NPC107]
MHKIALEWVEEGRNRSQAFTFDKPNEQPIRIGRDERQCDVIIKDLAKTVSGLHVEIFFDTAKYTFYLRNLTKNRDKPNPAWVNGQKVVEEDTALKHRAIIQLGKMTLTANVTSDMPEDTPVNGLKCHVCGHVSPQSSLSLVCQWCGTSLASAPTAVYFPDEKP